MERHEPLNDLVAQIVDQYVGNASEPFTLDDVVDRVLANPEVQLMRKGLDVHDRAEGLEDVFVRDLRERVERRLKEDGCTPAPDGHWNPSAR